MDIESAANFLVGSILTGLGFCIIAIVIVFINNILSKYWKPVSIVYWQTPPSRFATEEEMTKISPLMDKSQKTASK
jgi:hypothetical protein